MPSSAEHSFARVLRDNGQIGAPMFETIWTVGDIGKPGVPRLTADQLEILRRAFEATPSCARHNLQFAFPAISDGAQEHEFVVLHKDRRVFFTESRFLSDELIVRGNGPPYHDLYLISGNPWPSATAHVSAPCDPKNF